MEHQDVSADPDGQAPQSRILDLPSELLLRVVREVEDEYVERGESSAEFLQLRAVCKKLQQSVDAGITNLSRGIAHRFCHPARVLEVRNKLQRELALWASLGRVELHVRGSHSALLCLIPALGQRCPGLTALHLRVLPDLDPPLTRTCEEMSLLTSLASLQCLSLRGFHFLGATLPVLPSLRTLHADVELACLCPLPSLEELVLGSEHPSRVVMPDLHASPHLRRLSLKLLSMDRLRLPQSLQVLDLDHVRLTTPLDFSIELPELVELLLVYPLVSRPDLEPRGLATLLSRGHLRRLKLQHVPGLTALDMLSCNTGLTSLSLHPLEVAAPHVLDAVAVLTSLTELELGNLPLIEVLDISHLKLQRLELERLPNLSSIKGLDIQTQLTSLTLTKLPLVTHLPDLGNFRGLAELKLQSLQLENWSPGSCSCYPKLKVLHLLEVEGPPPHAILDAPSLSAIPRVTTATVPLDLQSLTTLTDVSLWEFDGSALDVALLPLLEKLRLEHCRQLAHLVGIRSLPRLRSLELRGSNPLLETLTIASCPRLTTFSCEASHLQSLDIEDLPLLLSLQGLPFSLRSLRVASCPAMQRLHIMALEALENLDLSEVERVPSLSLELNVALKCIRLNNLTKLSHLGISNCPHLTSFHVSGSPLKSLSLVKLPHFSSLDPLSEWATQTGLTSLRLQGLHLTHLPESLGSLTALSQLELVSLEVDCWEPALPEGSLPTPCQLATSGNSSFTPWETVGLAASPTGQWRPTFSFIKWLSVDGAKVESLDVSQLVSIQSLSIKDCALLTCLAGIVDLPDLDHVTVSSSPKLQGLAAVRCPRLSLIEFHLGYGHAKSLLHLHLEDLQSLNVENFRIEKGQWEGSDNLRLSSGSLVSLKSLKLRHLPSLATLELSGLPALESLEVDGCSSLQSTLLSPRLRALPSLSL